MEIRTYLCRRINNRRREQAVPRQFERVQLHSACTVLAAKTKRNEHEEFCNDFDVAPDGVLLKGRRGDGCYSAGGWQDTGGVL